MQFSDEVPYRMYAYNTNFIGLDYIRLPCRHQLLHRCAQRSDDRRGRAVGRIVFDAV